MSVLPDQLQEQLPVTAGRTLGYPGRFVLGPPALCLGKPCVVWDNLRKTLTVWGNCAGPGFGEQLLLVSTSQNMVILILQAASAEKNLSGQVRVYWGCCFLSSVLPGHL